MITKGLHAILSSWLFVIGIILFIVQIDLSGGLNWLTQILLPILISAGACFNLGWRNSQSLKRSLTGALVAILIGIPLAYFILAPVTRIIWQTLVPSTYKDISFSVGVRDIWFFVSPVLMIELVTDNALTQGRWQRMILSVLVTVLLLIGIEVISILYFTHTIGDTSTDLAKLAIYAPIVWGIIVMTINSKLIKHDNLPPIPSNKTTLQINTNN